MRAAPRKGANVGAWSFCVASPVAPQGRGNGTFLVLLCFCIAKRRQCERVCAPFAGFQTDLEDRGTVLLRSKQRNSLCTVSVARARPFVKRPGQKTSARDGLRRDLCSCERSWAIFSDRHWTGPGRCDIIDEKCGTVSPAACFELPAAARLGALRDVLPKRDHTAGYDHRRRNQHHD